jgi:hypothetical protein
VLSLVIGGAVFLCLLAASAIGMFLRFRLPEHHLNADSRDAIKLATAVIGTLSALALGLLIASAKSAYDDARVELGTSVARVVLLDRVMAQYGPETAEARVLLRKLVEARLNEAWGSTGDEEPRGEAAFANGGIESVQSLLRSMTPRTDAQRQLQSRAFDVSGRIAEAHWLHAEGTSEGLPGPFLVILTFWLSLLFATFSLLAPSNGTVAFILLVCALSVAGAVFLIVDMAHPYLGFISISDEPLRAALEYLGRR